MAQAAIAGFWLALAAASRLAGGAPPAGLPPDSACATVRGFLPTKTVEVALDSVTFSVGGSPVSVCYTRAVAGQGEPGIGSARVPYGAVWRTGGSTPAVLYTVRRISIGGVVVPPGRYVLYTVPAEYRWQVVINRTVNRWADGPDYDAALQAGELGRVGVAAEGTRQYVQRLTLRPVPAGPNVILLLEWENVQVAIPIIPG